MTTPPRQASASGASSFAPLAGQAARGAKDAINERAVIERLFKDLTEAGLERPPADFAGRLCGDRDRR